MDIYNINNGARFQSYVINGNDGEIGLNGAAARLVHPGDLVIIASYNQYTEEEVKDHEPKLVFVDAENKRK